MVFRTFNSRAIAGLLLTGFAVAGCQSTGKAIDSGALKPDATKVKASDLRGYCPSVTLREGTAFYNNYAKGGQDDSTKLIYQAALSDVTRDCTRTDSTLGMKVAVAGKVVPGPLGKAGTVTLPIRVAVVQGSQVLYSKLYQYQVHVNDTSAATQFVFNDPNVSVPLPAASTYQVFAGFDEGPAQKAKSEAASKPAVRKVRKKRPAPAAAAPAAAPAQAPTQTHESDIPRG
ncbi:hypothetical protein [Mesorhizobium sp. SP-1A]|uniref:hypothetical protein n=1 Tax=Mesorhizobium sp. SP-1A TaxID=3077840 RepID=UPI0028F6CB06|nr:hypothetical protein [Mesorhizobium sp. SP-1A]